MIHSVAWEIYPAEYLITVRYTTGTVEHYLNKTIRGEREGSQAVSFMLFQAYRDVLKSFLNQRIIAYNRVGDHEKAEIARWLYGRLLDLKNIQAIKTVVARERDKFMAIMPSTASQQAGWIPCITQILEDSKQPNESHLKVIRK
jgi:hypothetical protein